MIFGKYGDTRFQKEQQQYDIMEQVNIYPQLALLSYFLALCFLFSVG